MRDGEYDLIVVGGGPSGAIAAYHAASAGLSVLVLDKADFPRSKTCAGGLTPKTVKRLPFAVDHLYRNLTGDLEIAIGWRDAHPLSTGGVLCAFVLRAEFDAYLLERARRAGAAFRRIGSLDAVHVSDDEVTLRIGGGERISAAYVIAADGANSRMRRLAGPPEALRRGFAIEGVASYSDLERPPPMEVRFGVVERGYGWVFPKDDHANVGLYTVLPGGALGKERLRDYARFRLGTGNLGRIVGFPLGFGGDRFRHDGRRILFVGDAAGMTEPLLGEGLHNAVATGELAGIAVARAVRSGAAIGDAYDRALEPVRRDLRRCSVAARLFYSRLMRLSFRALRAGFVHQRMLDGYAAGLTLREASNNLARLVSPKLTFVEFPERPGPGGEIAPGRPASAELRSRSAAGRVDAPAR